ncbi:MAG: hypothetical protein QHG99_06390 [Methanomicrobiales archaeon]|nr:hypothetical protein [Methanomicrobiales archaeon]
MSVLRLARTNPIRAKRIKLAAACRCELCGDEMPLEWLELHTYPDGESLSEQTPAMQEGSLLVLCAECHRQLHLHGITVQEQEALVRERTPSISREITALLSYRPKPYTPPSVDLEESYREASAPNHYRVAG